MALSPGTRLGPYEILSQIGAGGMGEVYKARDTRLNRTVAIKVLPDHIADVESRARLEREARAISSLDHPNICALYDVGQHGDAYYIVMQFLDGQTLADRLARGPLPLDLALRIAIEIAAALEHAHRAGIVHRDLKPGNVMLTGSGARGGGPSKLLDFGLAKPQAMAQIMGVSDETALAAAPVTAEGVIVGTVRYMAPEQVEGKDADARTDMFAFGVLLHEMITGAVPFDGPTPASIIGSILRDTPPAITERQPHAPPALARVVARSVAKDPDDRWQSAADLKHELQWIQSTLGAQGRERASALSARGVSPAWRIAAIAAVVALLALGVRSWMSVRAADTVRLEIVAPSGAPFAGIGASAPTTQFAVSPDGRQIAFVAGPQDGQPALWLRSLDALQPQKLAGTEGAASPFWSPDNRFVAFFAHNKLMRVNITTGGLPQLICPDVPEARGGAWGRDDVIVFAPNTSSGLDKVNAAGGVPTPALALASGDLSYRWPAFLSDGKHFVYYVRTADHYGVYLSSVDGETPTRVLERAPFNAIVSAGYLLTMREGTLLAYPFDERRGRVTGEPIRVADQVSGSSADYASFSASTSGTLAYSSGLTLPSRLEWFDRAGNPMGPADATVGDYSSFAISPDQKSVAFARVDPQVKTSDVWLLDLARSGETPVTTDPGSERRPVWSPDSTQLVYGSDKTGGNFLFIRSLRLPGPDPQVGTFNAPFPTDWSPDGHYVLFHAPVPAGHYDVLMTDVLDKPSKAIAILDSTSTTIDGRFSPDGHWLAYASEVRGTMEVFVRAFPTSGGVPAPVSTSGGSEPHWRHDGREIYYLAPDRKMMAVSVTPGTSLVIGAPKALFQTRALTLDQPYRMNYDVTADGSRFLIATPVEGARTEAIDVVLNWLSEVRKQ